MSRTLPLPGKAKEERAAEREPGANLQAQAVHHFQN
jgi:hypothetical protein